MDQCCDRGDRGDRGLCSGLTEWYSVIAHTLIQIGTCTGQGGEGGGEGRKEAGRKGGREGGRQAGREAGNMEGKV